MKAYLLDVFIILFLVSFLCGCNSKSYEIEEEIDSSLVTSKPEIKQDLEEPKLEIKEETKQVPKVASVSYTIQLGAFSQEANSLEFVKNAKQNLTGDVYTRLINGLYKVRYGSYNTKEEAISNLNTVRDLGYDDAFIIEIKKLN